MAETRESRRDESFYLYTRNSKKKKKGENSLLRALTPHARRSRGNKSETREGDDDDDDDDTAARVSPRAFRREAFDGFLPSPGTHKNWNITNPPNNEALGTDTGKRLRYLRIYFIRKTRVHHCVCGGCVYARITCNYFRRRIGYDDISAAAAAVRPLIKEFSKWCFFFFLYTAETKYIFLLPYGIVLVVPRTCVHPEWPAIRKP